MAKYRINYKQSGLCERYDTVLGKYVTVNCDTVPKRVQRAAGAPTFPKVEKSLRGVAVGERGAEPPVQTVDLDDGGLEATTTDLPGEETGGEGFNVFGMKITGTHIAVAVAILLLIIALIYFAA